MPTDKGHTHQFLWSHALVTVIFFLLVDDGLTSISSEYALPWYLAGVYMSVPL